MLQWCCEFQQETKQSPDSWGRPISVYYKGAKDSEGLFFFFFLSLLNSMNLPWCEWIDLHKYAGATFVTQEAALLKVIMKYCACWDLSDLNDWKGRVPMISNMPDMRMTAYGLTSNMCTGPSSLHHYRCEMAAVWFGHQNWFHLTTSPPNNKHEYRWYWASCTDDQISQVACHSW